jgi:hypothetical protein
MNSDMENREWINDYMSLKQVNPANPFTVPAGYFDSLESRIVSYKNISELKGEEITGGFTVPENYFDELNSKIQSRINIGVTSTYNDFGFTVPEGYFDELTSNIQSRINIEAALNTEATGFIAPEGYFDELTSNIHSRIAVEEALENTEHVFSVPEGYFENLEQQIKSRIFVEEALAGPVNNFEVPQNYFEDLNKAILNKTVNQQKVQRRGVVRKLFATTAFKYATAACFALLVGGGILITELNSPANEHKNSFLHKQLLNVPMGEMENYLKLNVDAGDTQQTVTADGAKVNDADLKNALQNYADSLQ